MFYFRINKLKIIDNREEPIFFFIPNPAEVKLISFVTTGDVELPEIDDIMQTNDKTQKKKLLRTAVEKVASARIFTEIHNVKDNHVMYFGDTGYVLYQAEKIPDDINWVFLAIESDRPIREFGEMIEGIVKDSSFNDFASNIITLLASATNPTYVAAVEIAKYITKVTAKISKANEDDQIGMLYMSLNRVEHYPHGKRDAQDVPDMSGNMFIDYSIFGFENVTNN